MLKKSFPQDTPDPKSACILKNPETVVCEFSNTI